MSKPRRRRRITGDTADEVCELLLSDRVRAAIHARIADLLKATMDAAVGVRCCTPRPEYPAVDTRDRLGRESRRS